MLGNDNSRRRPLASRARQETRGNSSARIDRANDEAPTCSATHRKATRDYSFFPAVSALFGPIALAGRQPPVAGCNQPDRRLREQPALSWLADTYRGRHFILIVLLSRFETNRREGLCSTATRSPLKRLRKCSASRRTPYTALCNRASSHRTAREDNFASPCATSRRIRARACVRGRARRHRLARRPTLERQKRAPPPAARAKG